MNSGKKVSIYFPEKQYQLLKRLSLTSDDSLSKVVSTAVSHELILRHENLQISDSAYLALSLGRFDLLVYTPLEDGLTIVSVDESALVDSDGLRSVLADKKAALVKYLNTTYVYAVLVEVPTDLFIDDWSDILVTKYFNDKILADDYKHDLFAQFMTTLQVTKNSFDHDDCAVIFLKDGGSITILINELVL